MLGCGMTASKTKYYFRKKTKSSGNEEQSLHTSSSAESDDLHKKMESLRQLTLHIITDPGQSTLINSAFQHLVHRLDSSLDVICISERFKPFHAKESVNETGIPKFPSLAVVLFFKDEFSVDEIRLLEDCNNQGQIASQNKKLSAKPKQSISEIRNILAQKPWRFHHKVAVTGKLISCDSNQQDYYEFIDPALSPRSNGFQNDNLRQSTAKPNSLQVAFPLWGVRKVHYGYQILRFTLFASQENWQDQISLYKLILRTDETRLRDDFCYFETFFNDNIAVQLGLKKLPTNVQPQPLTSSILQFKVKNVGQLVPLLPYSCDPISELRWRTRDHDSNLILLQIDRNQGTSLGTSFVKKVFPNQDNHSEKTTSIIPRSKTPISSKFTSGVTNCPSSTDARSTPNPEGRLKSDTPQTKINFERNELGDSFVCPSLPEKMPLLKTPLYFIPSSRCSSSSSNTSLSGSNPARSLSPNSYSSGPLTSRTSTPKLIKKSAPSRNGRISVTPQASDCSKSSKEDGFYV